MYHVPTDDREGPWIALLCAGILLTSLASTVCLGLIVLYAARLVDVGPVLACFATGAVLVVAAAARLDHLALARARTRGR